MKIAVIISIFILAPFIIITLFRKYKLAKNVGTVIMAYAVGVLLSFLFSFTDFLSATEAISLKKIQETIMSVAVSLAIPLMLFSSDFKMWTKSLPKAVLTLCMGVIAIIAAVLVSFFIFKTKIPELYKVGGMMTAFYTGGTMNFSAVSNALKANGTIITLTLTSEMIIMFILLVFLTAGGYKLFRWLLPAKDGLHEVQSDNSENENLKDLENYERMLSKKIFPKTMLGFLLSLGFLAVGAGLSILITGKLNELVVLLTITTLAIAASFNNKIRNLPKTFELGMFFILIFSVIVASLFDISMFKEWEATRNIFLFVLCITLSSFVIHGILCRFTKVPGDLFTVSHIALLCSPPFIPPLVSAMGNRKVLISGITIGLVGYAIGKYFGVLMARFLGWIEGVPMAYLLNLL
jgi:uncharacterized membrane protein